MIINPLTFIAASMMHDGSDHDRSNDGEDDGDARATDLDIVLLMIATTASLSFQTPKKQKDVTEKVF